MSNKVNKAKLTSDQSIVNTFRITKKGKRKYSESRFQIKNQSSILNRPMQTELTPEQMEVIASTRPKLKYETGKTYKLVNTYVVDYEVNKRTGEQIPLDPKDHFRVGIYAVPTMHTLV